MAEAEMYEGEGENSLSFNEDLFDDLQSALRKLVQVYQVSGLIVYDWLGGNVVPCLPFQIDETDLQSLLNVISQLWEHLDESSSRVEKFDEQQKELEGVWNEEKEKRRQAEKVRICERKRSSITWVMCSMSNEG